MLNEGLENLVWVGGIEVTETNLVEENLPNQTELTTCTQTQTLPESKLADCTQTKQYNNKSIQINGN